MFFHYQIICFLVLHDTLSKLVMYSITKDRRFSFSHREENYCPMLYIDLLAARELMLIEMASSCLFSSFVLIPLLLMIISPSHSSFKLKNAVAKRPLSSLRRSMFLCITKLCVQVVRNSLWRIQQLSISQISCPLSTSIWFPMAMLTQKAPIITQFARSHFLATLNLHLGLNPLSQSLMNRKIKTKTKKKAF